MISINLLPDIKQARHKARRARQLVITSSIIVIIASILVPVIIVIYHLSVTVRINLRNDEIAAAKSDLKKVDDLSELLTVQSQLQTIDTVDKGKVHGGNFVSLIERTTPKDTNITSMFSSSEDSRFELSASSPSVPSAENFIDTLLAIEFAESENDNPDEGSDLGKPKYIRPVSNLSVSSFSYDRIDKKYSFKIEGEIDPGLWSYDGIGYIRLNPTRLKIAKEQQNIQLLPKALTSDEQDKVDEDVKKQADELGISVEDGKIQTPAGEGE